MPRKNIAMCFIITVILQCNSVLHDIIRQNRECIIAEAYNHG